MALFRGLRPTLFKHKDPSWTMAPITMITYTNPAFFVHQSQKLQALLAKVVQESSSATGPEAAIDFLQLTEILAALLDEAQLYSILSPNELGRRQSHVHDFMSKFETIESAVGDWNLRVASDVPATSRKRGRASTSENEASKSSRARSNEQERSCA
ncbi:hypothetical protein AC579_6767 [Pseudocercospora musae]|uniref:Uncharacterized protein n=1 Tax=Pseudocercospora musae TaxID=113226 RepID=A0A139HF80_9PEZI|nr:hypothetical protein AC579_6767 [Pseudocercospora musae]